MEDAQRQPCDIDNTQIRPDRSHQQEQRFRGASSSSAAAPPPAAAGPAQMNGVWNRTPTSFMEKLYDVIDCSASNETISWSGEHGFVWNQPNRKRDFVKDIFGHEWNTFRGQLRIYKFRRDSRRVWTCTNANFQRGRRDLLENVRTERQTRGRRKRAAPKLHLLNLLPFKPDLQTLKEHSTRRGGQDADTNAYFEELRGAARNWSLI